MDFLKEVAPKYGIISVGLDNDYGHPHKETMERLNSLNVKIFRTDQHGTIVARSDGTTISIDKQPIVLENNGIEASKTYIGNKNSKVFHLNICSGLPKLENQIKLSSKSEAENGGYKPCQICKP
jgi:competence protein ComEC